MAAISLEDGQGPGITGDKTQATQGGKDCGIVKTDGNGVKQWMHGLEEAMMTGSFSFSKLPITAISLGGTSFSGNQRR
jgi:hypothetical protein